MFQVPHHGELNTVGGLYQSQVVKLIPKPLNISSARHHGGTRQRVLEMRSLPTRAAHRIWRPTSPSLPSFRVFCCTAQLTTRRTSLSPRVPMPWLFARPAVGLAALPSTNVPARSQFFYDGGQFDLVSFSRCRTIAVPLPWSLACMPERVTQSMHSRS